jgi:hypothetical protein
LGRACIWGDLVLSDRSDAQNEGRGPALSINFYLRVKTHAPKA